jgi:hypothetical protein
LRPLVEVAGLLPLLRPRVEVARLRFRTPPCNIPIRYMFRDNIMSTYVGRCTVNNISQYSTPHA